jgi:hypothetical protein
MHIYRHVVFDDNVYHFASLHRNASRRLSQDILLVPTENNACTNGDTQHDDHMPLPIIPVVTNPTQGTPPPEYHTLDDENTDEDSSENDEEMRQTSDSIDPGDTNNLDADPVEDPIRFGRVDPEEDPPSRRP